MLLFRLIRSFLTEIEMNKEEFTMALMGTMRIIVHIIISIEYLSVNIAKMQMALLGIQQSMLDILSIIKCVARDIFNLFLDLWCLTLIWDFFICLINSRCITPMDIRDTNWRTVVNHAIIFINRTECVGSTNGVQSFVGRTITIFHVTAVMIMVNDTIEEYICCKHLNTILVLLKNCFHRIDNNHKFVERWKRQKQRW